MRTRVLVAVTVAALAVGVIPTRAEQGDSKVRFGAYYCIPTDDLSEPGETIELEEALGFEASYEYAFTDRIAVEPVLNFANHDVSVSPPGVPDFDLGEIDFIALTANLNFHLLREREVDLYLGPTIGYIFWGDLKSSLFGKIGSDDQFTYGVNLGVDVPFGEGKWAFSGGLTYLAAEITLDDPAGMAQEPDLGVDPFLLRVGLAYRF